MRSPLLHANPADNRLEVDLVEGVGLRSLASISVGLEPVSVSQRNRPEVFDLQQTSASPTVVPIAGEEPRALATDGTVVWCAISHSGNDTTVLPETVVSSAVNPYRGDPNPPPNSGNSFVRPIAAALPNPPDTSLIVRKGSDGAWRDVNNKVWSAAVTWGRELARVPLVRRDLNPHLIYATANLPMVQRLRSLGDPALRYYRAGPKEASHVGIDSGVCVRSRCSVDRLHGCEHPWRIGQTACGHLGSPRHEGR